MALRRRSKRPKAKKEYFDADGNRIDGRKVRKSFQIPKDYVPPAPLQCDFAQSLSQWTDDHYAFVQDLAERGFTLSEIAEEIGTTEGTLKRWQRTDRRLQSVIRIGREYADSFVEQSLYSKALSGDVPSMIFWLKNRQRSKWRDRVEQEVVQDKPFEFKITIATDAAPPMIDATPTVSAPSVSEAVCVTDASKPT